MKLLFILVPFAVAGTVSITKPVVPLQVVATNQTEENESNLSGRQEKLVARAGEDAAMERPDRGLYENPAGAILSAKIHNELRRDKVTRNAARNVEVENKNGEVILRGQVPTRIDEVNVVNRVRSMNGVARVVSELSVQSE